MSVHRRPEVKIIVWRGNTQWAFVYSKFQDSWFISFYVHGSVHRESVSIIVQQDATIYSLLYFCKLLYMFRVVNPSIIRSTYNCNYSVWQWSPPWWKLEVPTSTTAEVSRDGWTIARCCNYSYMCSWWWMDLPPEACRAVYRNIINCIWSHLVGQFQFQLLQYSGS